MADGAAEAAAADQVAEDPAKDGAEAQPPANAAPDASRGVSSEEGSGGGNEGGVAAAAMGDGAKGGGGGGGEGTASLKEGGKGGSSAGGSSRRILQDPGGIRSRNSRSGRDRGGLDEDMVDPNSLETVEELRRELVRVHGMLRDERERSERTVDAEARAREELDVLQKAAAASGDGASAEGTAALADLLRKRAEDAERELEETRRKLAELDEYTSSMDEQFNMMQAKLQEVGQGGRMAKVSPIPEDEQPSFQESSGRVMKMIDQKNQLIGDLQKRLVELEGKSPRFRRAKTAEGDDDVDSNEIPYDVLDRLDEELAQAHELLLEKDAEIGDLKKGGETMKRELKEALEWKERAVQAQKAGSVTNVEAARMEKELSEERGMRRALEARFDEKLKLKIREVESLTGEVARLKRNGEQLGPVLSELERSKAEFRERMEQRDKEVRRLQSSLAMCEADRQKAEGRVAVLSAEMSQAEQKVKNSEEVRWRAGMNLAKAKAEMDWRMKADQEKDFFLERMKDELERLKSKLMRAEMRKLKVLNPKP